MRNPILFLAILVLAFAATSSLAIAANTALAGVSDARTNFVNAFNARDLPGVAKTYAPTVDWVDMHGNVRRGKDEVLKATQAMWTGVAKLTLTSTSTKLLSSSIAIDSGVLTLKTSDGEFNARYTAVLMKDGDRWVVVSLRNMAPVSTTP